ncbi:YrzI family small protein [Lysinibacillus irui]|uniref:YrzI family small protein n=1 Tax=Lysinibacillus irui TaxID=2998077 RepID=A0AAJ5RKF6_9BACI|nr:MULTISPECIES: YrzI family small protein [Lysinibacillus]MEA0551928.1 YrzI family small protein [Lysinibacillus irui]MEA0563423.1 YrzI family small protein [Lysinibacillus irui]MEA0977853.1 YrzI family small protein [Lysinibacillus irui]MEA1044007.1 YrzI family small protein [Lysinibacillus irui]WDV07967.1 YrzI family small protein [Lysinibacillus irui]
MILNIFALTITITKREISLEKALHDEYVKKIFEENRRKVENYIRIRQF